MGTIPHNYSASLAANPRDDACLAFSIFFSLFLSPSFPQTKLNPRTFSLSREKKTLICSSYHHFHFPFFFSFPSLKNGMLTVKSLPCFFSLLCQILLYSISSVSRHHFVLLLSPRRYSLSNPEIKVRYFLTPLRMLVSSCIASLAACKAFSFQL